MESIYTWIGKKLRAFRARRGLTQQVVAEKAGISTPFLSFLETGRKKGSLETYHKLAIALDVGLDSLFKDASSPPPHPAAERSFTLHGLSAQEKRALYQLVNTFRKRRKN